jgi:hypothetical protein
MSRYVCHFLVNLSPQHVRSPLKMLFEACGMDTMYETDDYVMAREIPGRIIFTKLVTSEVSIDVIAANVDAVRLSFLVKNEELPLNLDNHCRQVFDLLRMTIAHNYNWESIDRLPGISAPPVVESDTDVYSSDEAQPTTVNTLSAILN